MNILYIDTVGKYLKLIIYKGDQAFFHHDERQLAHSVNLMPELERLMQRAELSIADFDVAAVCIGPGSFTGIRIGVAALKGLFFGRKTKIVCINSLELFAYSAKEDSIMGIIADAVDWYYAAHYLKGSEILPPAALKTSELKEYIDSLKSKTTIFGAKIITDNPNVTYSDFCDDSIKACIDKKIDSGQFTNLTDVEPLYIRKSQAEGG